MEVSLSKARHENMTLLTTYHFPLFLKHIQRKNILSSTLCWSWTKQIKPCTGGLGMIPLRNLLPNGFLRLSLTSSASSSSSSSSNPSFLSPFLSVTINHHYLSKLNNDDPIDLQPTPRTLKRLPRLFRKVKISTMLLLPIPSPHSAQSETLSMQK